MSSAEETWTLFVGTYADVVHTLTFKPKESSLTISHSNTAIASRPSWIVAHPTERVLYVTEESEKVPSGGIIAVEVERDGALKRLIDAPGGGAGTVSVDVSPDGRVLAVAN